MFNENDVKFIIDDNEFLMSQTIIKDIISFIKKSFEKFYKNSNSDEIKFKNTRESLFKSMDGLLLSLKDFTELNDEYFDFKRIRKNVQMILDKDYNLIKISDIDFIQKYCDLFFNILDYKLNLLEEYNFIITDDFITNYNHTYFKFKNKLQEMNFIFQTEILDEDYHDKSKLINYCKTLPGEF